MQKVWYNDIVKRLTNKPANKIKAVLTARRAEREDIKMKKYLVEWTVWNAKTQTYEPENLCDFAYAESDEEAIDLVMDFIIDYRDEWDIERDDDILKLHHEFYNRHEDYIVNTDLEYRNFRVYPIE